jgi:LytS/YehU family sensor histidine kinase
MAAASSFISAVLFKSFWYFLLPLFQIKDYQSNFISSIPVRSAIYFFNIAVIAIYKMYEINRMDQNLSEQRKTETENLRKDAELLQLKYQLQPHFLFNSLNSINALIASKPQQAKEMVQLLADFLRGTLKSEENALIEVKEELDQINRYLAIEKVRFGHRLQTKLTIEADDLLQLKLPSMILQPIVENAIKFGLYATTEEVVIAIHIMEQPNGLYIHISNPFDETYKHNNSGIGFGISSIYRRLQLIYGRSDLFTTETINQTFIATLCIPK